MARQGRVMMMGAALAALFCGFLIPASASTQMVAVQVDVDGIASPDGMARARRLAAECEDALMSRLFDSGCIVFNRPPLVRKAGGETDMAASVENLLVQARLGGAIQLVLLRFSVSEPSPGQALHVSGMRLSAIPAVSDGGPSSTWAWNSGGTESDARQRSAALARELDAVLRPARIAADNW